MCDWMSNSTSTAPSWILLWPLQSPYFNDQWTKTFAVLEERRWCHFTQTSFIDDLKPLAVRVIMKEGSNTSFPFLDLGVTVDTEAGMTVHSWRRDLGQIRHSKTTYCIQQLRHLGRRHLHGMCFSRTGSLQPSDSTAGHHCDLHTACTVNIIPGSDTDV